MGRAGKHGSGACHFAWELRALLPPAAGQTTPLAFSSPPFPSPPFCLLPAYFQGYIDPRQRLHVMAMQLETVQLITAGVWAGEGAWL